MEVKVGKRIKCLKPEYHGRVGKITDADGRDFSLDISSPYGGNVRFSKDSRYEWWDFAGEQLSFVF